MHSAFFIHHDLGVENVGLHHFNQPSQQLLRFVQRWRFVRKCVDHKAIKGRIFHFGFVKNKAWKFSGDTLIAILRTNAGNELTIYLGFVLIESPASVDNVSPTLNQVMAQT